jgi:gluconolactonase
VITDLVNPNGLAFSADEKKLYVIEWKGTPNRSIRSYDLNPDNTLGNRSKLIDAADQGALDGFRVDRDGNLWCDWGSNGALQDEPTDINGRKAYQLKG